MKALLIGYGEVGMGVYDYYSVHHDIDICDPYKNKIPKNSEYDVALVTIPYSDLFVEIVNDYIDIFNPKVTIVFSSVPIGTTAQINNAVHSPVEGKHPRLGKSMETFQRFVGGVNNIAIDFLKLANQYPIVLPKPDHTEFLKLQSTSNYGLMIEYARYVKNVCDSIDMDYEFVKIFNNAYNELYESMGYTNFKRYVLDAPTGEIGGHCIVPNSKLLDKQFPSMFLKVIHKECV